MIINDDTQVLETLSGPMTTYTFCPVAKGQYPGIVFFSDIFQVTPTIRRIATFFAGQGFVVTVPEIFHELEKPGTMLPYLGNEGRDRGNKHKITKLLSNFDNDIYTVLKYLNIYHSSNECYCSGKIGVIGMSIGGHLALRAAMNQDVVVSAGACLYATDIHTRSLGEGKNDDTLDNLKKITGELVMIWGKEDKLIPLEGRATIYLALTAADIKFQWHEFQNGHAFVRDDDIYSLTKHPERNRYDPAITKICFDIIVELFKRKLC